MTGGSCGGREIEGVANEDAHVLTRSAVTAACSAVDVSDLPRRAVACGSVDEVRCEVNVGVVGPDVIRWVVFEWTGAFWTDGDVERG